MKFRICCLLSALFLAQCAGRYETALYEKKPAFYAYVIGNANYKVVHAYNADVFVTPSSCQKIITALLVYKTLGSSYRYSTQLYTDKKEQAIISFSGDPTLTSEDLYILLKPLKNKRMQGDIILDASLFQTPVLSPNIMRDDVGKVYSRPISAMNLDQNLLTAKKSPEDLDPYVIEKVHRVLKRLNIMGRVTVEHDPNKISESKILVNTVQSKTLKEIMPPALKKSDNFVFDCLYLKIVSLHSPSPIKKWEEGDAIIKNLLRQHFDIDIGKALIVDGSGLSRYNRIQPQKLYELLCKACKEQEFIDTLTRPLEPSTLLQQRTNLPKTIKAKTGSMSGISGLCGYNFEKSKGAKVFVMFASNFTPPLSEVYVIQDQFIRRFC